MSEFLSLFLIPAEVLIAPRVHNYQRLTDLCGISGWAGALAILQAAWGCRALTGRQSKETNWSDGDVVSWRSSQVQRRLLELGTRRTVLSCIGNVLVVFPNGRFPHFASSV